MNTKHYKELLKDVFQYLTFSGVLETSNILLLPVLTRAFSRSAYGLIDGITLIITLSSTAIGMAMPSAITRLYFDAQESERPRLVSSMLFVVISVGLISLIVAMVAAPYFRPYFEKVDDVSLIIVLAVLAGFMNALFSAVSVLLRIDRRIAICQIMNLMLLGGYVVGTCIGIYVFNGGIKSILYSSVISSLICTIWAGWSVRKDISGQGPTWKHVRELTTYAWPLMIANFSGWVNMRGSRSILILQLGLVSAGVYAAGIRIAAVFALAVSAFQQAWSYYSMTLLKKGGFQSVSEGILRYYTGVVAIIALLLLMCSYEIVDVVLGHNYVEAVVVLPWIIGGTMLRGMATIVNAAAVIQRRSNAIGMAYIFSAVVNILMMLLLMRFMGMRGASIAYFLSECFAVVYFAYDTKTRSEVAFKWKQIVPNFMIYLIISNILVFSQWMEGHLFLRIIIGLAACALILRSIGLENLMKLIGPLVSTQVTVSHFFDSIASTYSEDRYGMKKDILTCEMQARKRAILALLDAHACRSGKLLDAGCGSAPLAHDYLDRGFDVWGIDSSEQMITEARARFSELSNHFKQGDIEGMAFPDESFDLVVSIGVFHYLKDEDKSLREIFRVLRPGGVAVVSVSNAISPSQIFRKILMPARFLFKNGRKNSAFFNGVGERTRSPWSIDRQLKDIGFKKVESCFTGSAFMPCNISLPSFYSRISSITDGLSRTCIGSEYIVLAQKV